MRKYLIIEKNKIILNCLALLFFSLMPSVLSCKEASSTVEQRILESQMFMNEGDYEESRFVLEQALKEMPKEPKLYFHLGAVYISMGLLSEAAGAYEAAVRIHPGYIKALAELASVYRSLERWDEAVMIYERMIEIDPSGARPYFEKAMIYRRQGLLEEEKQALSEAYRLNPQFVILSARLQNFEIDEILADTETVEKKVPVQSPVSIAGNFRNATAGAEPHHVEDEMQNIPSRGRNDKFGWSVMLLLFTAFMFILGRKKFLR